MFRDERAEHVGQIGARRNVDGQIAVTNPVRRRAREDLRFVAFLDLVHVLDSPQEVVVLESRATGRQAVAEVVEHVVDVGASGVVADGPERPSRRHGLGASAADGQAAGRVDGAATRELRELVRHPAKLVGLRSHGKVEIHAVLAKCGVQVLMSDLFSPAGEDVLDRCPLPGPFAARVQSLRRLIVDLEVEIELFTRLTRAGWSLTPATSLSSSCPVSGRYWRRCSWPGSAT